MHFAAASTLAKLSGNVQRGKAADEWDRTYRTNPYPLEGQERRDNQHAVQPLSWAMHRVTAEGEMMTAGRGTYDGLSLTCRVNVRTLMTSPNSRVMACN